MAISTLAWAAMYTAAALAEPSTADSDRSISQSSIEAPIEWVRSNTWDVLDMTHEEKSAWVVNAQMLYEAPIEIPLEPLPWFVPLSTPLREAEFLVLCLSQTPGRYLMPHSWLIWNLSWNFLWVTINGVHYSYDTWTNSFMAWEWSGPDFYQNFAIFAQWAAELLRLCSGGDSSM